MPIPSSREFQEPLLHFLNGQPGPVRNELVHKALADYFHLTLKERSLLNRGGIQVYKNRIAWAYVNLQLKGLCVRMNEANEYQLSDDGRSFLKIAPGFK